jgi:hypothetical protein
MKANAGKGKSESGHLRVELQFGYLGLISEREGLVPRFAATRRVAWEPR